MSEVQEILIYFVLPSGEKVECKAKKGLSVLETAHRELSVGKANLEGACEGSLACSTCHVILSEEDFAKLSKTNQTSDDEEDMLDLAFGVTKTSRLACQIMVSEAIEGFTFIIPANSRNNK